MSTTTTTAGGISSYEQACSEHEWDVPERYNIAADVCDKHPRSKPARSRHCERALMRR